MLSLAMRCISACSRPVATRMFSTSERTATGVWLLEGELLRLLGPATLPWRDEELRSSANLKARSLDLCLERPSSPSLSAMAKICASSWPSSRERTKTSCEAKRGLGNRTASPLEAKFLRKRRKCEASTWKSVCIWMCSQNSSAACRIPSSLNCWLWSASLLKRSSHAKSASRSSLMPGRRHFTAISLPSCSTPKKTSAMLPLARGRGSSSRIGTLDSFNTSSSRSREVCSPHGAETLLCMRPSSMHTASGKMSRRVASHCDSFTKQGPQLSNLLATNLQ
mmetsp:Transcript_39198/g.92284  ORF Transcript_39198/g.92284 Transcript_39198/m.92284 type:complete len:280 (+) Transcript_39198:1002-1841(+)